MSFKKVLSVFLAIALIISCSLVSGVVFGAQQSSIELQLDKTTANVGDVIKATISITNINDFAGFQANLKYDPEVLRPICENGEQYTKSTYPESGTLLNNSDFGVLTQAANKLEDGVLTFGKVYTNLQDYKASKEAESNGSVAVISFEVISESPTSIVFEDTQTMPNGITGTNIFNWNGNRIVSDYSVIQAEIINSDNSNPVSESNITLEYDKTSAKVGETVKVYLNVNNIADLCGYQVNLKYDPEVLKPITSSGKPYDNNTILSGGDMLKNEEYSPFCQSSHNIERGILNFCASYLNLEEYKLSNKAETTGELGFVEFEVLKETTTTVSFEDTDYMPNAVCGTMFFNWNTKRISEYKVIAAGTFNSQSQQTTEGKVSLVLDKSEYSVGDIVNAKIEIDNISDFAGYQINLSYDPTALKPITKEGDEYTQTTIPLKGDLLQCSEFSPYAIAAHNINEGLLNIGGTYTDLKAYRESESAETIGTLLEVSFKVLKAGETSIMLENSDSMPNGICGTILFDWNGDRIVSGYTVCQPQVIEVSKDKSISLKLDKKEASTGDIVKANIIINEIENMIGFQVNLKYNPEVLQLVSSKGKAYTNSTIPEDGELLCDENFGIILAASHNVEQGLINFSKSYTNLEEYKKSGNTKNNGSIATLYFKVLSNTETFIKFEDTITMPNGICGTILIDWNGNRISSDYKVLHSEKISIKSSDENISPEETPVPTDAPVATPTPEATPTDEPVATPTPEVEPTDEPVATPTREVEPTDAPITTPTHEVEPTDEPISTPTREVEPTDGPITTPTREVEPTDEPISTPTREVAPTDAPIVTPTHEVEPTDAPVATPTPEVAPTDEPVATSTPTPTPTPTPSNVPVGTPENTDSLSCISIDFDQTDVEVGDTIKATVRVNEIADISGYQINLKYDPEVLQPIKPTGDSYSNGTIPSNGNLISNPEFGPINAVSHNLDEGILNFAKLYTALYDYRTSEIIEETGTIAIIEFRVIKDDKTNIEFKSSSTMPNCINGTMIFNSKGERITSGYSVIQPIEIN